MQKITKAVRKKISDRLQARLCGTKKTGWVKAELDSTLWEIRRLMWKNK